MKAPFRIESLGEHDRTAFTCGSEPLDRYFKTQASQDVRRRLATCFVALEAATDVVAGYYTMSAAGMAITDLPAAVTKRLPRYPTVPAVRIGRLAVAVPLHGRGLGAALLADAAARALAAEVAAFALLVDAKDEDALRFYEHFGFTAFESQPRTLFLPLATAARASQERPPR